MWWQEKKEDPLVDGGQVLIEVWCDKQYVALVSTLHTAKTVETDKIKLKGEQMKNP